MTYEAKMKLEDSLMAGSQMILDSIEKRVRESQSFSLAEMKCMSETMGQIADIYKDIHKAHHYEIKM